MTESIGGNGPGSGPCRGPARRSVSRVPLWVAGATALMGGLSGAGGQSPDALRDPFRLDLSPAVRSALLYANRPGSSVATPTAYGASWGQVFVGAGWQERGRYIEKPDGAVMAGLGFGNPRELVGLEVVYTSFSTVRSGFFSRTALSFKVHRVLSGSTAIAAGWENALVRGPTDGGSSGFGVVSHVFHLGDPLERPFRTLTASLGVGNGRFRSERQVQAGTGALGVFGSVGLRLVAPVALIADWTGQDLALGTSVVPIRSLPLVLTAGVQDVTRRAGDGPRLTVGAGAAFDLLRMF